jgi:hypothetical protein
MNLAEILAADVGREALLARFCKEGRRQIHYRLLSKTSPLHPGTHLHFPAQTGLQGTLTKAPQVFGLFG